MRELRRKQFFSFLADFFDKEEKGHFANKTIHRFTPEEKEEWIKKYFKKYYMENMVLKEEKVRLKIDTDMASKKRHCSCTVGLRDEKTGQLIPPEMIPGKQDKYITIRLQRDMITQELKEAQLGNSLGCRTQMKTETVNKELDDILAARLKDKVKPSKQTSEA